MSLLILAAAFGASFVLHVMIAELAVKAVEVPRLLRCFPGICFRGKYQKVLTAGFCHYGVGAVYQSGGLYFRGGGNYQRASGDFPVAFTASVLCCRGKCGAFGLKAVGISEKLAVTVIFLLVGVLAFFSLAHINNPLPVRAGRVTEGLAYFGIAMFAFFRIFRSHRR